MKKRNVLGLLVAIDPCIELKQILDWADKGNRHLLTTKDLDKMLVLAERCEDQELRVRFELMFQKR